MVGTARWAGVEERSVKENCGQARGLWGSGCGGWLAFEATVAVTGHEWAGEAGRGGAFHAATDRWSVANRFGLTFETSSIADGGRPSRQGNEEIGLRTFSPSYERRHADAFTTKP